MNVYAKMTWPEIDAAAQRDALVLVPAGTLEDHGRHLPLDTDVVIPQAILERVAEARPQETVLLPSIMFGFSPHHMDYPGPITIGWETFVRHTRDVILSVAHHGFRRVLIVNGHGSNRPALDLACRLAVVARPTLLAGMLSWWELTSVRAEVASFRESEVMAHACELETSAYLGADGRYVHMERATREVSDRRTPHVWSDLMDQPPEGGRAPVHLTEYWSVTAPEHGVLGDPTKASKEKGERVIAAAAAELAEIVDEFRRRQPGERVRKQSRTGTDDLRLAAELREA